MKKLLLIAALMVMGVSIASAACESNCACGEKTAAKAKKECAGAKKECKESAQKTTGADSKAVKK